MYITKGLANLVWLSELNLHVGLIGIIQVRLETFKAQEKLSKYVSIYTIWYFPPKTMNGKKQFQEVFFNI